MTYSIFETTLQSNQARISLVTHIVRPSLEQKIDLASARDFLGI